MAAVAHQMAITTTMGNRRCGYRVLFSVEKAEEFRFFFKSASLIMIL